MNQKFETIGLCEVVPEMPDKGKNDSPSLDTLKDSLEQLFSTSEPDYTGQSKEHISLADGTSVEVSFTGTEIKSQEEIFAPFGYTEEHFLSSTIRNDVGKHRDLFAEFGFDPKDMFLRYRSESPIIGSNNLDFFEAFDEFTDESLYSSNKRAGPNCMAYAYGMPKELNGTAYKQKPSPGHFAGLDTSEELGTIMEYGSDKEVKAVFEKYMKMDFDALGKKMVEVDSASYQPQKNERMFALVTSPRIPGFGSDFHFYVKGKNGYWSHKPGTTNPTIFDESGNTIKDPSKCNRGMYSRFIGFYVIKDK